MPGWGYLKIVSQQVVCRIRTHSLRFGTPNTAFLVRIIQMHTNFGCLKWLHTKKFCIWVPIKKNHFSGIYTTLKIPLLTHHTEIARKRLLISRTCESTVSFVDGVLPKARIPREWLRDGQSDDINLEIDGEKQTLPAAAYMIVLTNNVTGKHTCLNFLWLCYNAPETEKRDLLGEKCELLVVTG